MVVSSRKVIFYNSEADKAKADPSLILDLSKLFHVRSVTQGDVIRADTKEIPRIFQLLYAGEGESRKPTQNSNELQMLKEVRATFCDDLPTNLSISVLISILIAFNLTPFFSSPNNRRSRAPSSTRATISFRSAITCQLRARSARSRCGTCSSHRQHSSVEVSRWELLCGPFRTILYHSVL